MVYDYFKSEGIICLSDEEKIYIQETAIDFVKNKKEQLQKESVDIIFIRSISHFLNNITGKTEDVIVYSKKIALSYQIRNWILEDKTINDISQILFLAPNRRLQ